MSGFAAANMGVPPTGISGAPKVIRRRATNLQRNPWRVADSKLNRTLPFLAGERAARVIGPGESAPEDGTYRVLASLVAGEKTYRVFGDLKVERGHAVLRFFRFEQPGQDEWFTERKVNLPVPRPEIARLEHPVADAKYVLCSPVRLDESKAESVFGGSGPPFR